MTTMIDIDVAFEKELFEKLQALTQLTKSGVIEMLYRIQKQPTMISDFSRKYRMHAKTAQNASEILIDLKLIEMTVEGRKKILSITEKGEQVISRLEQLKISMG
ncbi:MAG: hypothetical protein ACTSPI_14280 [Candidatus Heimdallarchaeaceae archaeon]